MVATILDEVLDRIKPGVGLIIRTDGLIEDYNPTNAGNTFDFPQLKKDIGCNYGEIVYLSKQVIMVCDEEGLLVGKPINPYATTLYQLKFRVNSLIVGDVVICHTKAIK